MIDGLRLRVPSVELVEHCRGRAAYHAGRADLKREQLEKMRPLVESLKVDPQAAQHLSNISKLNYRANPEDALEALESDIRDHHNKSLFFTFVSGHLFDEDYNLKEDDLVRLEMLKR